MSLKQQQQHNELQAITTTHLIPNTNKNEKENKFT
jgi:hypothetical protein